MRLTGSGMASVGKLLAERLAYPFIDADGFHSRVALTGTIRDTWIDRVEAALTTLLRQGSDCVLAFSGLHARHRRQLMKVGFSTSAFLLEGRGPLLAQRIARRAGHFMSASQPQHQLETMEPPVADEQITSVDIQAPPGRIAATLAAKLT